MSLADDIRTLRDRTLSELTDAHDYYGETVIAWALVQGLIRSGHEFAITSKATGTRTTHEELLAKSYQYLLVQHHEATFQQFIAIFESFFFDLLRLWLMAYPGSLGKREVDFKTILDAPDKDAITQIVVARELNDVLYDRLSAWFEYLQSRLDGKAKLSCPTTDEIAQLAEAKATRDVLVHNRGVANVLYLSKAGSYARFQIGERVEISEQYHRQTWDLIRKVVSDVSGAAAAKVTRPRS